MEQEQRYHLKKLFNHDLYDPVWYVGSENSIDEGISRLLNNLNEKGFILVGDMKLFDYLNYDQINYFILYKALSKLEYLEYMYEKSR